jgi:hypothetical protein
MSLTVTDGTTITKDPADVSVLHFDWDAEHLGPAVTFSGTPTLTPERISGDATTPLTIDQVALLTGSRKARFRMSAGAEGSLWRITCAISTNETPSQTKERSIYVSVVQR